MRYQVKEAAGLGGGSGSPVMPILPQDGPAARSVNRCPCAMSKVVYTGLRGQITTVPAHLLRAGRGAGQYILERGAENGWLFTLVLLLFVCLQTFPGCAL